MSVATRVFDCPQCGAPLPPASDGEHVTCKFCGHATTIDSSGADMVREQASRKIAEALFATLGAPPSLSQKIALALTNKWVWIAGSPFMLALFIRLGNIPSNAVAGWWESAHHERLAHVASPMAGFVLSVMWPAGLLIGVLVWSLFGERVDARRDLQAALASKPPKTDGGPTTCRNCDGPLDVPPEALGVRCAYCGADNLVQVPLEWAARAKTIVTALRLTTDVARARAAEGRRRVRSAMTWRLPIVAVILALVAYPAWQRRKNASWKDYRYALAQRGGAYSLVIRQEHDWPAHAIRTYSRCADEDARKATLDRSRLSTDDTKWCELGICKTAAMFALSRGDRLHLVRVTKGPVTIRVALADRDYLGGTGVLGDSFGDEIASQDVLAGEEGALAADVPIAISGWYKLSLSGPGGVGVEPCVVPQPQ